MTAIFEQGLPKTVANHVPLSPLTFSERSASIYPDPPVDTAHVPLQRLVFPLDDCRQRRG